MTKIIRQGEMTHKLIDEILDLKSNKARVEKWVSLGLSPMKGLSADFTKLMFMLYEEASGDMSMKHRYNCGSCQMTIYKKLQDFVNYGDNGGRPLLNWIDKNEQGVSIIIPAYKNQDTILDTIWSILPQAPDIQKDILLCVDACDDTFDKVISSDIIYDNVRLFKTDENIGPYIIRNSLLEKTKYQKIIFFDADDIAGPGFIEKVFKGLGMYEQVRWYCLDFTENIHQYKKGIVAIGCFATHKQLLINRNGFYPWRMGADSEYAQRTKRDRVLIDENIRFYRRVWSGSLTQREDTGMKSAARLEVKQQLNKMARIGYSNPTELNKVELVEFEKDDKKIEG